MPDFKNRVVEAYRASFSRRLANIDAVPQLAVLGLLSGAVTGLVIVLFRHAIEWPLSHFLPSGDAEGFESLTVAARLILPISGAIAIGLIWYKLGISLRKVGVAYVMERLAKHQGYIQFSSLVTQFVGGVLTVVSGQSAGREGPAVHLGAACSSLMGRYMRLPNNSIRTLVGCGTAAAISASFNTPIAGVIFAMEVVMMEYTIVGFTPVILASVSAAVISRFFYGPEPAFVIPPMTMNSLVEIPFIVAMGIVIAMLSALFVRITRFFLQYSDKPIFLRILIGGIVTALVAVTFPQIMGVGYDTVNQAIFNQIPLLLLCAITLAKLMVTATAVGLGMPSGLIGPTLFIGATAGGALGIIGAAVLPEQASSQGFYALLGMGAMMGSVLQAPLSALMAVMELTHNPTIILPAMLIIVVSSLVASQAFGQRSIFHTILQTQGLNYEQDPMSQALQRVSVGAIMDRNIRRSPRVLTVENARDILRDEPRWIIVEGSQRPLAILPTVDLARYLSDHPENTGNTAGGDIDLLEIPAQRRDVTTLYFQATLFEALEKFNDAGVEAIVVERVSAPGITSYLGVLKRSDVETYYQYKRK